MGKKSLIRRFCLLLAVLLLAPTLLADTNYAHMQPQPLVGFVVERTVSAASVADVGPDGISQLGEIFLGSGARTTVLRLSEPIPEDVRIIVLAGPQRSIPTEYLVRLWQFLERGNHVVLALDPLGHAGTRGNSVNARSGLAQLLATDYGISIHDDIVVEPWFTTDSIADLETSYSRAYADVASHSVTAPLSLYDLPVQLWGARTISAEPLGAGTFATPLLNVRNAYSLNSRAVLGEDATLEFDPAIGASSRLTIGALAEHTVTGSRIIVIGDSQSLQNGYGLDLIPGTDTPRHPGNWVFVERLVAWLLDTPTRSWPGLPDNLTWMALDGNRSDWDPEQFVATEDVDGDDENTRPIDPAYDIQQVSAFRNGDYLYLMIETAAYPGNPVHLSLNISNNDDGSNEVALSTHGNEIALVSSEGVETIIPDGRIVADHVLELRLPLRVTGFDTRIEELCLYNAPVAVSPVARDCLDQPANVPVVAGSDPVNTHFPEGMLITVRTIGSVNLRAGPSTETPIQRVLYYGNRFLATGRNEAGDWFQAIDAAYTGWLHHSLVIANGNLLDLPVIE